MSSINVDHLPELILRLCEVLEAIHSDLRPELKKTQTFQRVKEEKQAIENEASDFVRKVKACNKEEK